MKKFLATISFLALLALAAYGISMVLIKFAAYVGQCF